MRAQWNLGPPRVRYRQTVCRAMRHTGCQVGKGQKFQMLMPRSMPHRTIGGPHLSEPGASPGAVPPPYRISPHHAALSLSFPASLISVVRVVPPSLAVQRSGSRGAEAELATETGRAMARVHEKTEFSVSVIGCGRMGCAIAGRAPLSPWGGLGGGRVMIGLRAKVRVMTRRG